LIPCCSIKHIFAIFPFRTIRHQNLALEEWHEGTSHYGLWKTAWFVGHQEDPGIPGYRISLPFVTVWLFRELRLDGQLKKEIQLNLKPDGRPY
jgi:hypothetical protein